MIKFMILRMSNILIPLSRFSWSMRICHWLSREKHIKLKNLANFHIFEPAIGKCLVFFSWKCIKKGNNQNKNVFLLAGQFACSIFCWCQFKFFFSGVTGVSCDMIKSSFLLPTWLCCSSFWQSFRTEETPRRRARTSKHRDWWVRWERGWEQVSITRDILHEKQTQTASTENGKKWHNHIVILWFQLLLWKPLRSHSDLWLGLVWFGKR